MNAAEQDTEHLHKTRSPLSSAFGLDCCASSAGFVQRPHSKGCKQANTRSHPKTLMTALAGAQVGCHNKAWGSTGEMGFDGAPQHAPCHRHHTA